MSKVKTCAVVAAWFLLQTAALALLPFAWLFGLLHDASAWLEAQ